MAAGLGFKTFTTGEVLTAADTNGYLMQGILVFANAAARDAAITSPQEGQACYLKDTDQVLSYSGSTWVAVGGSPLTTKGDLYTFSTVDARLGVGANGTTLVADSSEATGLKWQTPVSGMTFISRTSFSNVASQAIDSVFSSTYFNYLVVIEGIFAATAADDLQMQMRYSGTTQTAQYNGNLLSTTRDNTTTTNTNQSSTAQYTLGLVSGDITESSAFQITFTRVGNSSEVPLWSGTGVSGASLYGAAFFGGSVHTARTYTGFLLKSSTSNITGIVSVYGLAKA